MVVRINYSTLGMPLGPVELEIKFNVMDGNVCGRAFYVFDSTRDRNLVRKLKTLSKFNSKTIVYKTFIISTQRIP